MTELLVVLEDTSREIRGAVTDEGNLAIRDVEVDKLTPEAQTDGQVLIDMLKKEPGGMLGRAERLISFLTRDVRNATGMCARIWGRCSR